MSAEQDTFYWAALRLRRALLVALGRACQTLGLRTWIAWALVRVARVERIMRGYR